MAMLFADALINDVREADEPLFEVAAGGRQDHCWGFSLISIVCQGPLAHWHIPSNGQAGIIFQLDAGELNSYNHGRCGERILLASRGPSYTIMGIPPSSPRFHEPPDTDLP